MTDGGATGRRGEEGRAARVRDPAGSREAILAAAELAFARDGFDGASLAQIGRAAGVSAALPAYFFQDKRGLYDAVIARLFRDRDATLEPICATATAALQSGAGGPARRAARCSWAATCASSRGRPAFVALMAREALEIPRRATAPRHSQALERGLDRFIASLAGAGQAVARPRPSARDARRALLVSARARHHDARRHGLRDLDRRLRHRADRARRRRAAAGAGAGVRAVGGVPAAPLSAQAAAGPARRRARRRIRPRSSACPSRA